MRAGAHRARPRGGGSGARGRGGTRSRDAALRRARPERDADLPLRPRRDGRARARRHRRDRGRRALGDRPLLPEHLRPAARRGAGRGAGAAHLPGAAARQRHRAGRGLRPPGARLQPALRPDRAGQPRLRRVLRLRHARGTRRRHPARRCRAGPCRGSGGPRRPAARPGARPRHPRGGAAPPDAAHLPRLPGRHARPLDRPERGDAARPGLARRLVPAGLRAAADPVARRRGRGHDQHGAAPGRGPRDRRVTAGSRS